MKFWKKLTVRGKVTATISVVVILAGLGTGGYFVRRNIISASPSDVTPMNNMATVNFNAYTTDGKRLGKVSIYWQCGGETGWNPNDAIGTSNTKSTTRIIPPGNDYRFGLTDFFGALSSRAIYGEALIASNISETGIANGFMWYKYVSGTPSFYYEKDAYKGYITGAPITLLAGGTYNIDVYLKPMPTRISGTVTKDGKKVVSGVSGWIEKLSGNVTGTWQLFGNGAIGSDGKYSVSMGIPIGDIFSIRANVDGCTPSKEQDFYFDDVGEEKTANFDVTCMLTGMPPTTPPNPVPAKNPVIVIPPSGGSAPRTTPPTIPKITPTTPPAGTTPAVKNGSKVAVTDAGLFIASTGASATTVANLVNKTFAVVSNPATSNPAISQMTAVVYDGKYQKIDSSSLPSDDQLIQVQPPQGLQGPAPSLPSRIWAAIKSPTLTNIKNIFTLSNPITLVSEIQTNGPAFIIAGNVYEVKDPSTIANIDTSGMTPITSITPATSNSFLGNLWQNIKTFVVGKSAPAITETQFLAAINTPI
ncbi:MAG: hypothetical protein NTW79_00845 [Candidatus Berkelbacteria bacterium]|nr:hypothetical protein [Candidatus Berkelbacteria bacterium]